MGSSPRSILAYGYNLGNRDSKWNFKYKPASKLRHILEDRHQTVDDIENLLLAEIVGFTERWVDPEVSVGYWARRREAMQKIGVTIETYCSYDYPGLILSARTYEANDWGAELISPPIILHQANQLLDKAIKALAIIPDRDDPSWILGAFYG